MMHLEFPLPCLNSERFNVAISFLFFFCKQSLLHYHSVHFEDMFCTLVSPTNHDSLSLISRGP